MLFEPALMQTRSRRCTHVMCFGQLFPCHLISTVQQPQACACSIICCRTALLQPGAWQGSMSSCLNLHLENPLGDCLQDKAAARAAVRTTGVGARDKMRVLLAEALAVALPDVVREEQQGLRQFLDGPSLWPSKSSWLQKGGQENPISEACQLCCIPAAAGTAHQPVKGIAAEHPAFLPECTILRIAGCSLSCV